MSAAITQLSIQIIKSVLIHRKDICTVTAEGADVLARRIVECLNLSAMSDLVLFERAKQVAKGYDAKQDDLYTLGQLITGAICFAETAHIQVTSAKPVPECFKHKDWPWHASTFHPEQDVVGNLVKAAAMLIAEAERISRERGELTAPEPVDDMLLTPQIKPGIDLAVKRDKVGQFLAAVSAYTAAVLCDVKPERLEEALTDVERHDAGQSAAMLEVQRTMCAWVRSEMGLIGDPAYVEMIDEPCRPGASDTQPKVGTSGCSPTCPDCGSADYWHEWTDAHKILRTACCGKLYRVLPGNKLEAVPSENEKKGGES